MKTLFQTPEDLKGPVRTAAAVTLVITLLRLTLELVGAPTWLASKAAGGGGALLGITWIPLIVGPWFALTLRSAQEGPVLRQVARALRAYGVLARLPVVVITIVALLANWGTHYEGFPFEGGVAAKIGATLFAQLGFWTLVWTPLAGCGAAWLALRLTGEPAAAKA